MKKRIASALLVGMMLCPALGLPIEFVSNEVYAPVITSSIVVTKKVIGEIWHIRCDIMDTTTFIAGGGKWKTDVIKNPNRVLSKEGHRSNKCGDDDHWVIWIGENGVPYRMDEIKSGATGGTLPTVVYKPRYEMSTEEIQNMEPEDIDTVYRYSQNFIDTMPWSEIKIGERLYWTTSNKDQTWYHSGIPYRADPNFVLYIDNVAHPIVGGRYIEIDDLLPGAYEIKEKPAENYYLGHVDIKGAEGSKTGEWAMKIEVEPGTHVEINWPNVILTPEPKDSPTPPATPDITPTPTPTLTPTPTPTLTPISTPTSTPTPITTQTPAPTQAPTPDSTPTPTFGPTSPPTTVPTNTPTSTPTYTLPPTQSPAPTVTPTVTPYVDPSGTVYPYYDDKRGVWYRVIDDYAPALGVEVSINHAGDCFD